MSTTEILLAEIQNKANLNYNELINRLLDRIVNPPIAIPSDMCEKHGSLLHSYRALACLRTKYNRLHNRTIVNNCSVSVIQSVLDNIYGALAKAKLQYRNAACTCTQGLKDKFLSPHAICCGCGEQFKVVNACRQPIHLAYKKGEPLTNYVKILKYDCPITFDVGSGL